MLEARQQQDEAGGYSFVLMQDIRNKTKNSSLKKHTFDPHFVILLSFLLRKELTSNSYFTISKESLEK